MSDSVRPRRRKPTRLSRPWDSPGKNTGVGCHFLLQCMKVKREVKSLSRVRLLATPWTTAYQAPLSMGFSRQEYWSGVPLPSPKAIFKQNKTKQFLATLSSLQDLSSPTRDRTPFPCIERTLSSPGPPRKSPRLNHLDPCFYHLQQKGS